MSRILVISASTNFSPEVLLVLTCFWSPTSARQEWVLSLSVPIQDQTVNIFKIGSMQFTPLFLMLVDPSRTQQPHS